MQEYINLVQFIITLNIREQFLMENLGAVSAAALCSSTGEKPESKYFVQPFGE